jgi:hypothetical protein
MKLAHLLILVVLINVLTVLLDAVVRVTGLGSSFVVIPWISRATAVIAAVFLAWPIARSCVYLH